MNAASWVLVAVIALLFVLALIYCIRNHGRSSCGGSCCKNCDGSIECDSCKKKKGEKQ